VLERKELQVRKEQQALKACKAYKDVKEQLERKDYKAPQVRKVLLAHKVYRASLEQVRKVLLARKALPVHKVLQERKGYKAL
jgi:hypothetical protein